MKILITGAKGQLGHDLVEVLSGKHELFPLGREELDVSDAQKVRSVISSLKPDIVIHCAAYTDVDGCELNPDLAYRINALGAQNVALTCQKASAIMVYISTDFVFDGNSREPYTEFDQPNPINVYGKSKLAGENYVASLLHNYFIIRTAWLFGKKGKNFVKTILKLAEEKEELRVVDDQVGSPTYSFDLAQKIAELIETEWFGVYHITNRGSCSWYEFARKILGKAGRNDLKVKPITSKELNRPAVRPANSILKNYVLELRGFKLLRSYEDALTDFFS